MNYFIDIPTFSRFYALNDEDDEKPPPDLKSTDSRNEERKTKKGRRRKGTSGTKETAEPAEEAMGSVLRKEKSSWPDWQFWKRSESSSGTFGAFRKSNKATGAFTFRKDINETVRINQSDLSNAHVSTDFSVHVGESRKEEKTVQGADVHCPSGESGPENDDPLVSYKKELNGSKHVLINMAKVETIAERKNAAEILQKSETSSTTKAEGYTLKGRAKKEDFLTGTLSSPEKAHRDLGRAQVDTKTRKPAEEAQKTTNGFVHNRVQLPKSDTKSDCVGKTAKTGQVVPRHSSPTATKAPQKEHEEVKRKENGSKMPAHNSMKHATGMAENRKPSSDSDEKPYCIQQQNPAGNLSKRNGPPIDGGFKTIKNSVIPLPRLNANEVARTKRIVQESGATSAAGDTATKGACLEQGKLHNVLRKVTENSRQPGEGGNATTAQQNASPAAVQAKVRVKTGRKGPGSARAMHRRPGIRSLPTANLKSDAGKKQVRAQSEQATRSGASTPVLRAGVAQISAPNGNLRTGPKPARALNDEVGRHAAAQARNDPKYSRPQNHPPRKPQEKPPRSMKDAATATPTPRAKVDAGVQVPCEWSDEGLDARDVFISMAEETENLLKKRPWDTERVLKMQVLLDERQVEMEQLKEAAGKQNDEMKVVKRRCEELEVVVNQANMEGKPQLVIQINELTDMKNELLLEVSRMTVDIEKERSSVKTLKTELVEVKGQLNSARKKNGNCQ